MHKDATTLCYVESMGRTVVRLQSAGTEVGTKVQQMMPGTRSWMKRRQMNHQEK